MLTENLVTQNTISPIVHNDNNSQGNKEGECHKVEAQARIHII